MGFVTPHQLVPAALGASWTDANASGIQSLAWRLSWESTGDEKQKQKLIRYNLDDCLALRRVTEFVRSVCEQGASNAKRGDPVVTHATGDFPLTGSHFGKIKFFCPELYQINKCAYSDYQREKIYVRTSSAVRKSLHRKERSKKKTIKVNEEVVFAGPSVCPKCGAINLQNRFSSKVVKDLKFSTTGVKRWCVRYRAKHSKCLRCGLTFSPELYRALGSSHFGSNLSKWVAYNHVGLRQSGREIAMNLHELFGFSFGRGIIGQVMPSMAVQYRNTYELLKDCLRNGPLIHADETKGEVKHHSGYVWAFTNLEEVVYTYTATREGAILDEMLDGFTGVLVSDFYGAYDSTTCPQQKCLIHLIRDINSDIFRAPFDEELKQFAKQFVSVVKPIIDTIDRFGLKRYFLRKHKDDVARFLDYATSQDFESEVALQYQKRVLKYRERLFTFLDHDGIPWNNNNAENAIKPFATRRKLIHTSFSERGLQNYLLFLSISQTCRNKNLSFLGFLLSGNENIDEYASGPK